MPRFATDLLGMTFGSLVVVAREANYPGSHDARWLCECSCGNRVVVKGWRLTKGDVVRCIRCVHADPAYRLAISERLRGNQFGKKLLGIRRSPETRQRMKDSFTATRKQRIRDGIKSFWTDPARQADRDRHIQSHVREGAAFRSVLAQYKMDARYRQLGFELSHDEFRALTQGNCFYCDGVPATIAKANSGEVFVYNGVDRLDSSKGYTVQNCVPCCRLHNTMKSDMTFEDFLNACRQVVAKFPGA